MNAVRRRALALLQEAGASEDLQGALTALDGRPGLVSPRAVSLAGRLAAGPPPAQETARDVLTSVDGDVDVFVGRLALLVATLELGEAPTSAARLGLDLYALVADRLGLGQLRERLEDAAFCVLEPEVSLQLREAVEPVRRSDAESLALVVASLRALSEQVGIEAEVTGRRKSLYGLYRKMLLTGRPLEQILDRIGVRVIVPDVDSCYRMLGVVHRHFRPLPGTFKDYIGLPKTNGYQTIHTTVFPLRERLEKPVEIQLRTQLMHAEAELGVAAHWQYRLDGQAALEDRHRRGWLRTLTPLARDSETFLDELRARLSARWITVFVEGGRMLRARQGCTAASLLEEIGLRSARVRLDGVEVEASTVLRDGVTLELVDEGLPTVGAPELLLGERSSSGGESGLRG